MNSSTASSRTPEQTRTLIVNAAADLMVEIGPAKLTHRNVAARAGVSVGSTTKYFSSIDDLRAQAIAQAAYTMRVEAESVGRALAEAEDPVATGVDLLDELFRNSAQAAAELALFAAASSYADPHMRELAASWTRWLSDALKPRFGEIQATALAVFLDGAWIYTALRQQPLPREVVATALRALITTEGTQA